MASFALLVLLSAAWPLAHALRRLHNTSLVHALAWAGVAWCAWTALLTGASFAGPAALAGARYIGLCLIGCAGVAVLGARRPGVGAWNFVVAGLLAVLLLSWMEGLLTGSDVQLGGVRTVFLVGTLAVGLLNYLPTRLAPAALLVGAGCGLELAVLLEPALMDGCAEAGLPLTGLLLGLAPWTGWLLSRRRSMAVAEVDRLWLDFRDRYGLVWGQRLREQFNRAMANARWPVELRWVGLASLNDAPIGAETQAVCRDTLLALFKRFGVQTGTGDPY